jgi:hypothetical protein
MKHDLGNEQQNTKIDNCGGMLGGTNNTINNGLPSWAVGLITLMILIGLISAVFIFNKKEPPKPSLAYHFLVDVSENMNQTINGVSQYDIANQAIQTLSNFGAFSTSRTLRGLRLAGGGESCNQTTLVDFGADIPSEKFIQALNQVSPSGFNAYERGLSEAFADMAKVEANIKVIFIMLGTLSNKPCSDRLLPLVLRTYISTEQEITPVICTFAIIGDDLQFKNFQRQMLNEGFGCVYQANDANDISQIAIDIMQDLISKSQYTEEVIVPPNEFINFPYTQHGELLPLPDMDEDGVRDNLDTCPYQGSIGFGIYDDGCPIFDTDEDGVPDNLDDCPDAGSVGFGIYDDGCPIFDTDEDGVPDNLDTCPYQGSVGFGIYDDGCPIFDTDEDGVPDNLDTCPYQGSIGFGIYANGCPILDMDADGVPDNLDLCLSTPGLLPHGCPDEEDDDGLDACPNDPGPASNNGCPILDTDSYAPPIP